MVDITEAQMPNEYVAFAKQRNPEMEAETLQRWNELLHEAQPTVDSLHTLLTEMNGQKPLYTSSIPRMLEERWFTDFGNRTPLQFLSTGLYQSIDNRILFDASGKCLCSPGDSIPVFEAGQKFPPETGNFRHDSIIQLSEDDPRRKVASLVKDLTTTPGLVFTEDIAFLLAVSASEEISDELLESLQLPIK